MASRDSKEIRSAIDPELQSSLKLRGIDDAMTLHHPLIIYSHLTLEEVERANNIFRRKKDIVERARRDGDFSRYVFEHEKPYRLPALMEGLLEIKYSAIAATLLADVWMQSENISQNQRLWRSAWRLLPDSRATMDQAEQNELAELPERFPIFRGHMLPRGTRLGLSWTIDLECAERFARRFADEQHFVAEGILHKKDVLALFTRRDERQIVVFPRKVIDIIEREIEARAYYLGHRSINSTTRYAALAPGRFKKHLGESVVGRRNCRV
jgi:hypothetical protein